MYCCYKTNLLLQKSIKYTQDKRDTFAGVSVYRAKQVYLFWCYLCSLYLDIVLFGNFLGTLVLLDR